MRECHIGQNAEAKEYLGHPSTSPRQRAPSSRHLSNHRALVADSPSLYVAGLLKYRTEAVSLSLHPFRHRSKKVGCRLPILVYLSSREYGRGMPSLRVHPFLPLYLTARICQLTATPLFQRTRTSLSRRRTLPRSSPAMSDGSLFPSTSECGGQLVGAWAALTAATL